MKTLLLLLTIIVITGCTPSTPQQRVSAYHMHVMPTGAVQLEVILKPDGINYAIFKFREQCFLQYRDGRAGGIANIRCPK